MLVPMDIDEDGRIDTLVQKCQRTNLNTEICSLSAIYNNIIFDSFYIKAMFMAQSASDSD